MHPTKSNRIIISEELNTAPSVLGAKTTEEQDHAFARMQQIFMLILSVHNQQENFGLPANSVSVKIGPSRLQVGRAKEGAFNDAAHVNPAANTTTNLFEQVLKETTCGHGLHPKVLEMLALSPRKQEELSKSSPKTQNDLLKEYWPERDLFPPALRLVMNATEEMPKHVNRNVDKLIENKENRNELGHLLKESLDGLLSPQTGSHQAAELLRAVFNKRLSTLTERSTLLEQLLEKIDSAKESLSVQTLRRDPLLRTMATAKRKLAKAKTLDECREVVLGMLSDYKIETGSLHKALEGTRTPSYREMGISDPSRPKIREEAKEMILRYRRNPPSNISRKLFPY